MNYKWYNWSSMSEWVKCWLWLYTAVDTSEAGDGEVVVDVTYDGRQMATRIDRKKQLYHVSFLPEGPGVYSIEVEFDGREVTGMCI